MSRVAGVSPNAGVRWDPDMGEFQLRCTDCASKGRTAYWPLTPEFWQPDWGMTRCRACWNERKAARQRARWRSDPEWRARKLEENREQRRAQQRVMYRLRWERLRADPEKYAAYVEARRARQREASARYRERQKVAA